jgi:hypothetical protein
MNKKTKAKLAWAKANPEKVRASIVKYQAKNALPISMYYILLKLAFPKLRKQNAKTSAKWQKTNKTDFLTHKAKYRKENLNAINMLVLLKYYAKKDGMWTTAKIGRPNIY